MANCWWVFCIIPPVMANAMVNLNMIDIIGSGIKKMFNLQRLRYFPLPDYDFNEPNRVKVRILGKIINENYTSLLLNALTWI